MTDKQLPKRLYGDIEAYVVPGGMDGQSPIESGVVSGFSGGVPDSVTWDVAGIGESIWHWDTDFSPAQEDEWDAIIVRLSGGTGAAPVEAELDAAIAQVQAFIGRSQTPTDAQRDATIDAMAVIIRHLWAKS